MEKVLEQACTSLADVFLRNCHPTLFRQALVGDFIWRPLNVARRRTRNGEVLTKSTEFLELADLHYISDPSDRQISLELSDWNMGSDLMQVLNFYRLISDNERVIEIKKQSKTNFSK